ncbi:MAG: hypothetical protein M1817_003775 [Caeruleum heppii]|nr:MAG: hypothetical protein M1817_003775 [Caeruleum heppii]
MVYSVNYRRPAYVESSRSSSTSERKSLNGSLESGTSGMSRGIPDALSFDRIISGGTCPPCTTRDFMNYLIYIEHAAENLQFFLWYRDYCKRFADTPANERDLAPEWTAAQAEAANQAAQTQGAPKKVKPAVAAIFKGTDFAPGTKVTVNEKSGDPFHTPPLTPMDAETPQSIADWKSGSDEDYLTVKSTEKSVSQRAAEAFEGADLKWKPFTIQPFREEIARIISTYLVEQAPRELNISSRERIAVLHALENTTHPSAFRDVVATVEWSLRFQAHPNFIRWSICNGNRPRVIFARGLGLFGILGGFITAIVLTLSSAGRGWRALSAIGFLIGISTLIAAWKGMCVVLHGMHHRHLRPWELFAEDDGASVDFELKNASLDSVASNNSYEDQPWVVKYEKRNILRKILDREVWIQEPALRQIQDTIFLQAIGASTLLTAVCVGVFVAIPKGGYF